MPTAVPTIAAATEPAASGMKIFTKPWISTRRSMLRMLPTMIDAMNRYRKLVDFVNSTVRFSTGFGSTW